MQIAQMEAFASSFEQGGRRDGDALEAQYVRTLDLGELGPTQVRGGFYNETRDLVGIADLLTNVGDDVGVRQLELRVGTRMYGAFLAPEDQDLFSFSLGGEARYFLGSARNSSVTLGLFYAPDITTFGRADHVTDMSLRVMTRLRNGTDVFAGYRALEFALQAREAWHVLCIQAAIPRFAQGARAWQSITVPTSTASRRRRGSARKG